MKPNDCREKQTASGKTKKEAVMLLNHKDTLDFILDTPDYLRDLSVARIEEFPYTNQQGSARRA